MTEHDALTTTIGLTIRQLQYATEAFGAAQRAARDATIAQFAQQREVETIATTVRLEATTATYGAAEKRTAAERDALIAHILATHPRLVEAHDDALHLRERAEVARAALVIADQHQKALRAELAALTALLAHDGREVAA